MNPFEQAGNPNDPNNQMFLMSLDQVNEQNMVFFLMQNPFMIEQQDESIFKKTGIKLLRNTIGSLILGSFLNIQMKRIPKFMNLHAIFRIPLRVPVFFSPFLIFQNEFLDNVTDIQKLHTKYYRRLINTKRSGDLRYLDPYGILNKQFIEKMKQAQ